MGDEGVLRCGAFVDEDGAIGCFVWVGEDCNDGGADCRGADYAEGVVATVDDCGKMLVAQAGENAIAAIVAYSRKQAMNECQQRYLQQSLLQH